MIRMKIEDISSEGLGIGHADGMAVFVKDTVIGDEITAKIIKVKKSYAFGRLMQLILCRPARTAQSRSAGWRASAEAVSFRQWITRRSLGSRRTRCETI